MPNARDHRHLQAWLVRHEDARSFTIIGKSEDPTHVAAALDACGTSDAHRSGTATLELWIVEHEVSGEHVLVDKSSNPRHITAAYDAFARDDGQLRSNAKWSTRDPARAVLVRLP